MCLHGTGACLVQMYFNVFACFGNRIYACLIQVACLIEVVTKTGFDCTGRAIALPLMSALVVAALATHLVL